jgi:hypothetical protein
MVSGLAVSVFLVALAAPVEAPQAVADAQPSVAAVRVYVGGVDVSRFEQLFHPPLEAGPQSNASQLTGIGRAVVVDAAGDINQFEREARRHFSASSAFELVSSPELADYVMVMEADYISTDFRRRMRGVLKLVDAKTGEEAYRRRVTFVSISTRSDLNRELTAAVNLMEVWAADPAR